MGNKIREFYGDRIRVRVCGLCWQDGHLLLVKHGGLTEGDFWAPPGGGLEFGESVAERLQKEFLEETGLTVSPGRFLFGCEFVQKPLHAIELYFEVAVMGGKLRKGEDPEMNIIEDVRYIKPGDIGLIPRQSLHGIFGLVGSAEELMTLTGFFRI